MNRYLSNIIVKTVFFSVLIISSTGDVTANEQKQMTMITKDISGEYGFRIEGFGVVSIDWGDGTIQTDTLTNGDNRYYRHKYSDNSSISRQIITITGENITNLFVGMKILSLDVSKNTELVDLIIIENDLISLNVSNNPKLQRLLCQHNQLTTLDLSKSIALKVLNCDGNQLKSININNCTELIKLFCRGNQLTNLDVSKNTALIELQCNVNPLTSLDLSNNIALRYLNCWRTNLSSEALNDLFETLHNNTFSDYVEVHLGGSFFDHMEGKKVIIRDNPGTNDCNKSIAKKKGWTLEY